MSTATPQRAATAGDEADRIVAAAWRVLARSGFRSLKVRQVIAEAGTSAFVFYRHFPSKSHLLLGLMRDEFRRAEGRLAAVMGAHPDPEGKVRAYIELTMAIAYDDQLAARARMFMEPEVSRELPLEVEEVYEPMFAALVDALELGVRQGVFRCEDTRADARSLQHLCSGVMTDRLAGRATPPRETAIAHVSEFVLRALRV